MYENYTVVIKRGTRGRSTQGQFSTSFDLDFHINAYNFISTVPPG